MKRTLAAVLLLGAVVIPTGTASANTGCRAVRGLTDPDVAYDTCNAAVALVPDALCDKYGLCLA